MLLAVSIIGSGLAWIHLTYSFYKQFIDPEQLGVKECQAKRIFWWFGKNPPNLQFLWHPPIRYML